ncbi:hypothetical protein LJB89_04720 [Tyzzerella sp. OttesenSCG-928-J15]|nr:hypothetical protein [Tyzzerella sp. OttesenSCG-928-J15]
MEKRSLIFGVGLGMIIAGFIFFIGVRLAGTPEPKIETVTEQMSDDEIIEQAKRLGMVMIKDLPDNTAGNQEKTTAAENNVVKNLTGEEKEYLRMYDEYMKNPAEFDEKIKAYNDGLAASTAPKAIEQKAETNKAENDKKPEPSGAPEGHTRVRIPSGGNSITISSLLFNSGVVDDATEFNSYVIEKKKSTKLIAGVYDIPDGASYDEIIELITKGKVALD